MINEEMIEAAATAIRQQAAARLSLGDHRLRLWHELPPKLQDNYRAEARAALEAAEIVKSRI